MSIFKVQSLLVAVTLISAAAPASAITRLGNAEASQVPSCVCQGKVFPDRVCPMIHCTDASASVASAATIDSFGSDKASKAKDSLIRSIFEIASIGNDRQICDKGTGKCK